MRCLVTGGLGFIGSHLVKALREQGHEVMVLDDGSHSVTESQGPDIVRDISTMLTPRADWIFHLAAVSRTQEALKDPYKCFLTNVLGSVNLLESERSDPQASRIVLASSNIVYGSPNPYWASKRAMEDYAEAYRKCYGLNVVVLRYSNTYGPGMRWDDSLCLAAMRRSAVEKGYVEVTGDGSQRRHFTHVTDIVWGTILACESNYQGPPVDLCHSETVSMNEAAAYFEVPVHYIPARVGDSAELPQNPAASETFFEWEAHTRFERGIQDVLNESKPKEVAA